MPETKVSMNGFVVSSMYRQSQMSRCIVLLFIPIFVFLLIGYVSSDVIQSSFFFD